MSRGLFITFEGPDGSGKSTQFRRLAERLRREGYEVVESAEPGGSAIGRQIRRILLDPANQDLTATAELLLMFAARAQNVEQVILPALAEGKIVLSDRFTDSTLAYQGGARGFGDAVVREIHEIACQGLNPDLTLCIDIDTEVGLARANHRNRNAATGHAESRLDQQTLEFHQKARAEYHDLARAEPRRFRLIDGQGTSDAVALRVWAEVEPQLAMRS
jgi:dTMP kinase